jgi:hypothetical protein
MDHPVLNEYVYLGIRCPNSSEVASVVTVTPVWIGVLVAGFAEARLSEYGVKDRKVDLPFTLLCTNQETVDKVVVELLHSRIT